MSVSGYFCIPLCFLENFLFVVVVELCVCPVCVSSVVYYLLTDYYYYYYYFRIVFDRRGGKEERKREWGVCHFKKKNLEKVSDSLTHARIHTNSNYFLLQEV